MNLLTVGHADLRKGNTSSQIRLAVPIAAAAVRAVRADRAHNSEHVALAVMVCVAVGRGYWLRSTVHARLD